MKTQAVLIELQEDCVFSASAATEGAHESLDRIPGSALLGAAASRLYAKLEHRDAYIAFHSGKLRFGDGLPWNGHDIGLPTPLCWHHAKTDRPDTDGCLAADKIFNFLHGSDLGDNRQPKQMRGGFVHADGRLSKPAHSLRLKTAIASDTGRASEGQLFGYDALHRGQRFVSVIQADDDLDDALWQQTIDSLQGDILLGRSRSAEYGRVRVSALDVPMPEAGDGDGKTLTLWLLSDLALTDTHGQPSLTPDGDNLVLPGAEVDWEKTFLRSRHYSPWNAARHGYDRERQVLVAGSVIRLKLEAPLDEAQRERLQQGIGLHREAGLGRLWVNPPLLAAEQPVFQAGNPVQASATPVKPDHPLITWLEARDTGWKDRAENAARDLEGDIRGAIERARNFAGVAPELPFGPSRSQWGTVLQKAENSGHAQTLFDALFNDDSGIIKPKGEGWNIEIPPGKEEAEWRKLAVWLKERLAVGNDSDRQYTHKLRVLARRLKDDIAKRRN